MNAMFRLHWAERNRRKKADYTVIALEARQQGITKATGPRRVSLVILHAKGRRTVDPDAIWKTLLDGLVKCGLLVDDAPAFLTLGSVSYEIGKQKGLRVILEDLPA